MFHKGEGNCLAWLFFLKIFQWFTKKLELCHKYNLLTNLVLLMEKIVKNSEIRKLTT